MARLRLGVVLLVPSPWRREVDGIRRALGDTARGRIDPHITLVPPTNVGEADLPGVLELVRSTAAAVAPLELVLGPVTTFGGASPVAYLAVRGARSSVASLHALRAAVRSGPLHRADEHDFVPHVTVAAELPPHRLVAATAALSEIEVPVRIDHVHLLREEPGHVWVPIADAPLGGGGGGVVGRGSLPLEITESGLADPEASTLLAAAGASQGFVITARSAFGRLDEDPAPTVVDPGRVEGAVTDRVVAVARGLTVGAHLELSDLIVAEGHRRLGIGRHLVRAVEALGRRRGCATAGAAAQGVDVGGLLASCGWSRDDHRWMRHL